MKTELMIANDKIELASKLLQNGVPFPNQDLEEKETLHNELDIAVKVIRNAGGSTTRHFKFYDNMANYEKGLTDLESETDLKEAFRCFIDDALSGNMDFKDFCENFGYDEDSRKAENVWKACKKQLQKFMALKILTSPEQIIELLAKQGIE